MPGETTIQALAPDAETFLEFFERLKVALPAGNVRVSYGYDEAEVQHWAVVADADGYALALTPQQARGFAVTMGEFVQAFPRNCMVPMVRELVAALHECADGVEAAQVRH